MSSLAPTRWAPPTFAAIALALLVTLPSLRLGFITDDYGFRAILRAPAPYGRPAYDLFRFAGGNPDETRRAIENGHAVWWAAPDLRIHFVRPLTGLLHAADAVLGGANPLVDHVHSIAWYVALLFAVAVLYRRLFPSGATAFVAVVVFGWRHAHVLPYAWIAARHVLVGGVPAVVALWALVRWRTDGWRPGRWVAPVALVIGFLGSEVALGAVAFWLAFELLRDDRAHTWRARFVACVPVLLVTCTYLVVYKLVGAGARGSAGYHDPTSDPVEFVRVALTRLPILLGDALLGVPAELGASSPARFALAGLVATAFVASAYAACRSVAADEERAALRWLVPGAIVASLIGVTGFPGGRVLLVPDVGFAALLGVLIARGFDKGSGRALRIGLVGFLAAVHLVLAPLFSWRAMAKLARRARGSEAVARHLARVAPANGREFLVASDPLVFLYPRGILADTQPGSLRCLSVLSAARAGHRFTRMSDRTLTIEPLERTFLEDPFETLFRAKSRPMAVGDTFHQCGATIRVPDVREGRPTRIEATFDRSLDAPDLVVLVWQDHRLERLAIPTVGESVEVRWSAGPSGS